MLNTKKRLINPTRISTNVYSTEISLAIAVGVRVGL